MLFRCLLLLFVCRVAGCSGCWLLLYVAGVCRCNRCSMTGFVCWCGLLLLFGVCVAMSRFGVLL